MAKAFKVLVRAASVGAVIFVLGFLAFAASINRYKPSIESSADGIVVLTGGKHRIHEAVRLLDQGKARRLLISGVNRRTSRAELKRLTGHGNGLFECCIDIGYQALDTIGNAVETNSWARTWHFRRLIIVTSNYHMPRSLVELWRAMPGAELQAYPVVPRNFHIDAWWRHPGTARLLVSEYLKFLPAVARFGGATLLRLLQNKA